MSQPLCNMHSVVVTDEYCCPACWYSQQVVDVGNERENLQASNRKLEEKLAIAREALKIIEVMDEPQDGWKIAEKALKSIE